MFIKFPPIHNNGKRAQHSFFIFIYFSSFVQCSIIHMYELCVCVFLSNGYGVSFFEYFSYYTGFSGRGMCVDVCVSVGIVFIYFCRLFCQSLGNGFMMDNCISE